MTNAALNIVPIKTKACSKCGVVKPFSEFCKNKDRKIGITPSCLECRRAAYKNSAFEKTRKPRPGRFKKYFSSYLLHEYGITFDQAKNTLDKQNGMCANERCGVALNFEAPKASKNRAVIDHDHKTGKFRAILCHGCNANLGFLENQSERVLGLIDYLSKH